MTRDASLNQDRSTKSREPRATLDLFDPVDDQGGEGLTDREALHILSWGNAKPPSRAELDWIRKFGAYPSFDPAGEKISRRVDLEIANLKEATRIIVYYHYLHRGRTMAQLPYWVSVDNVPVGVMLFSLPRLSVPLDNVPPMNLLELARLWLHSDVQGKEVRDSNQKTHAASIASCAVSKALRRVQRDWYERYPHMPDILAVVSWADTVHHEGTLYRAANFKELGSSGGSLHGNRSRPDGGKDQLNPDYLHTKTKFMYGYSRGLTDAEKNKLAPRGSKGQTRLFKDQVRSNGRR